MTKSVQQEFFHILAEFFERATGTSATEFAAPDTFGDTIRKNAGKLAKRGKSAFSWGIDALVDFYSRQKMSEFQSARETGGMKLVLGGSSRFTNTHLRAVRKMLLYADTILIPDPVLPWIEVERTEEKFRHVNLLENIFTLLRLKPLVDADLAYPAITVFPSYEKSLEKRDEETRGGIERLMCNFVSYYTGQWCDSIDETLAYARLHESKFLRQIENKRLQPTAVREGGQAASWGAFPICVSPLSVDLSGCSSYNLIMVDIMLERSGAMNG
ncbi:MAG TPA: hypothetical protein VMX14_02030 [Anaerolineae bacterium]|nr:hypothetical protein [Anaerolineae bacterium]